MENYGVRKWSKYSPEFTPKAVDRLVAGESATVIARELKIRRNFLYAWRNEGFGSNTSGMAPNRAQTNDGDRQQQMIAQQQQKIAELERLAGQQAAHLDFFVAALRAIKKSRPNNGAGSGSGSTQRSKA